MRNLRFVVGRNLSLFLEDKRNTLLSWVAVAIIISIYFIFLRDFMFQMVEDRGISRSMRGIVSDRLMVSGLLMVVCMVTGIAGMRLRVNDKERERTDEFFVVPVPSVTKAVGYVCSTAAISASYTMLTFILYEFYFYYRYGSELTSNTAILILLTIGFASLLNAFFLYMLTYWMKDAILFSSFARGYGTIVGFLTGAYLPYFFYGDWLKRILFLFPGTQLTSIMRQLFLTDTLAGIRPELSASKLERFQASFGICLKELSLRKPVSRQEQYGILWIEMILLVGGFLTIVKKEKHIADAQ